MGTQIHVGDRCLFATTTTGTSTYQIGAAVAGYLTPDLAGVANGSRVSYTCVNSLEQPTIFEVGEGILTTTTNPMTLTRIIAYRNSSGGTSLISWAAGTKYIALTPRASRMMFTDTDTHWNARGLKMLNQANGQALTEGATVGQLGYQVVSSATVAAATGSVVFSLTNAGVWPAFNRFRIEWQDVGVTAAGALYFRVSQDAGVSYLQGASDYLTSGADFGSGGLSAVYTALGYGRLTNTHLNATASMGWVEFNRTAGRGFQIGSQAWIAGPQLYHFTGSCVVQGGTGADVTHVMVAPVGTTFSGGRFRLLGGV